MVPRMLSLPIPLALLLWPIALALGQGSLTPPPISAPESSPSVSASRTSSSASSAANGTSSVNATSIASATSSANFPSLSGYSPCVANCLGMAVSETGCNSLVDVQCFCTNTTRFTRSIVNCISSECPGDLTNAETLSQQFCNVASPSVSLSFPSPLPTQSSSSSPSSSSSRSASLTSSVPSVPTSINTSVPTTTPSGSGALGIFGQLSADNLVGAVVIAWSLTLFSSALSW
ncbi:unnamed protein product [Somion occarium]|uniref:CFEM domain-containing protein n=1 Tax=Somion occarium TaxID=3059160 RepID=A0ABP1DY62_9APHY